MRIAFISNYFNHHQSSLSREINLLSDVYRFIETALPDRRRLDFEWERASLPSYVVPESTPDDCKLKFLLDSDFIISGSTPERFLGRAIKGGKYLFRYSERPLKNGRELLKYLPRWIKWRVRDHGSDSVGMLCASAYAAADYSFFGLYRNRMYKWGYFPKTSKFDNLDDLLARKNRRSIVWAARFIDWKHPEVVVSLADRLKMDGYAFSLNIFGDGPMRGQIEKLIDEHDLSDCVFLSGAVNPDVLRCFMEDSGVFVFTSDRREGWGAVLNEAMNSGCAVISSHLVGAAPYLIRHGENGYVYRSGDTDELYRRVKYLLDNPDEQRRVGEAAYKTIVEEWNAEVAAERFVNLAQHILDGDKNPDLYESGPCSRAEIIREDWYKGES